MSDNTPPYAGDIDRGAYVVYGVFACVNCGAGSVRQAYVWDGAEFCVRCNCGAFVDAPASATTTR